MNQHQQYQQHQVTEERNLLDQAISRTVQQDFTSLITDDGIFQKAQRIAEIMAGSGATLPKHLHKNFGDCFAIAMQALSWGMSPWSVAQKTHLVNGALGYEAQLVNAVICTSGAIEGRFHYEYGGNWDAENSPDAWVRVGAIIKGESEIQWGEPLYPAKVTVKNSPLWKSNPKQQSGYLAIKYWARTFVPSAILGVYSADELPEQSYNLADAGITPQPQQSAIRKPQAAPAATQPAEAQQAQPAAEPQEQDLDKRLDAIADALVARLSSAADYEALEAVVPDITCGLPKDSEQIKRARKAYCARRDELDQASVANQQQVQQNQEQQ